MKYSFILVLFVCSLAHGVTAFVQLGSCVQQSSPGATCTITFSGNMTAGNTVTVHLQSGPFTFTNAPVPTIAGATCWPLRLLDGDSSQGGATSSAAFVSDWICPNVPGGAATVGVTAATVGTVNFTAFALEFSGLGTWPAFDLAPSTWPSYGSGGAFAPGATSIMSVSGTTTAGSLVIFFGGQQSVGSGASCTSATFTQPAGGSIANTNSLSCIQYNLSSAGGATTGSQTTGVTKSWDYHMVSINPGSTPYLTNLPPISNGYFVQKSTINAFAQHALTDAFPVLAVLPNGNIGMAYEQDSDGGQGSGPNSTAAFATTANGGASWTDYSGATQGGTQCATLAIAGCIFSGDGLAADSHWFEGYGGLIVNGPNTYYTIGVESSAGNCVKAMLSISPDSGATWGTLINVDTTTACWFAPPIFIPGGSVSSLCPSGCIIAPITEGSTTFKFLFSTDGGTTWPTSQALPTVPFNQLEDYCWWGGSNQIICVARSSPAQPLRVFSTPDFGATWTVSAYFNTVTSNTAGLYNTSWQLTSPIVINPNLGDGRLSVLFGDRGSGQIRSINATTSSLLTSPNTIGQGQVLSSFTAGNTEGYEAACLVSSNTWLFAWYAPNGIGSNGQIFTMQGTYATSATRPGPLATIHNSIDTATTTVSR